MTDSLIIIPTYNEVENIGDIISSIQDLEQPFDILIVDDNSPDGTADAVRESQTRQPNHLFLEVRLCKEGLGKAYIHGFRWALDKGYKYIFQIDADGSHNSKDLSILYDQCDKYGADIAIGSRYIKGINVIDWPLNRILLSYLASVYVRLITQMRIYDPTAGFICYRREVLEALDLDNIQFVGYAFQIEMKYKAYLRGFILKEVSIIFRDRQKGKSKMSKAIIREAVIGVISMKIKAIQNKLFK